MMLEFRLETFLSRFGPSAVYFQRYRHPPYARPMQLYHASPPPERASRMSSDTQGFRVAKNVGRLGLVRPV